MAFQYEAQIEINCTPAQVWQRFVDVQGWKDWNRGILSIELHGPFADGSAYTMNLPQDISLVSTLIDVRENLIFVDQTPIGGNIARIYRRIVPLLNGHTRVWYIGYVGGISPEITGPEFTRDFPVVLSDLKALIERAAG